MKKLMKRIIPLVIVVMMLVPLVAQASSATVTYKDGDNVVTDASGKVLPRDVFVKDGSLLAYWNTEPDGSGENIAPGTEVTGDITLYPVWIENAYRLIFDANTSAGGGPNTNISNTQGLYQLEYIVMKDEEFQVPYGLNWFKAPGRTFSYWTARVPNTDEYGWMSANPKVTNLIPVGQEITFYAYYVRTLTTASEDLDKTIIRVTKIEEDLIALTNRVTALEEDMIRNYAEHAELLNEINNIAQQILNLPDYGDDITEINNRINALTSNLSALQNTVNSHTEMLNTLNELFAALDLRVTQIQNAITEIYNDIADLQAKDIQIEGQITDLQNKDVELLNEINNLKALIAEINSYNYNERIVAIENYIANLEIPEIDYSRIEALERQIQNILNNPTEIDYSRIEELERLIAELTNMPGVDVTRIETIENKITEILNTPVDNSRVEELESELAKVKEQLAGMKSGASEPVNVVNNVDARTFVTSDLSSLKDDINTLKEFASRSGSNISSAEIERLYERLLAVATANNASGQSNTEVIVLRDEVSSLPTAAPVINVPAPTVIESTNPAEGGNTYITNNYYYGTEETTEPVSNDTGLTVNARVVDEDVDGENDIRRTTVFGDEVNNLSDLLDILRQLVLVHTIGVLFFILLTVATVSYFLWRVNQKKKEDEEKEEETEATNNNQEVREG